MILTFVCFALIAWHFDCIAFHPKRALVHIRLLDRKLIMEKGFLDKVEDNAAVRTWSETTQQEKGDSLADGYVSV